jgi:hypothetical protein
MEFTKEQISNFVKKDHRSVAARMCRDAVELLVKAETMTNDRTAIDWDKLNDEFRMIISHAYLGCVKLNDMGLDEFNTMLDNLVKAVKAIK